MRKIKISHIILLLLITFAMIGLTYSKYVNKKNNETIYNAADFYFESSVLSDEINIKEYNYAKGVTTISLDLENYIDELRYADVPINYEVSITDTNGNSINDINGNLVENQTGTFAKSVKRKNIISFSNLATGTYIVTAKSLSPYTKTIKAKYVIQQNDNGIEYSVSDANGSNTALLTVSTSEYSGNITISWPQGLIPDSTDQRFSNVNTQNNAGSITLNFNSYSEYTFQFFKTVPSSVYTKPQFTVVEN